jgi:hypothetical protein
LPLPIGAEFWGQSHADLDRILGDTLFARNFPRPLVRNGIQ